MNDTATEARKKYETDPRFRAIAMSCVMEAINQYGRIDPEEASRAAQDIALNATANLLQRIYTEDAELRALRQELDHYKALALRGLHLSPMPPLIVPASTLPQDKQT